MQCLDRFNKRMNLSGGSLREEYIYNTRELLKETFADDPSFVSGVYFWKLGLKEYQYEPCIKIRLYNRSYSAANGVVVKFQTLYDTPIIVGDIIYDSNKDEYLICTEAFDIDGINYKGKFTLCNWILKWQKSDGTILEYPCYDMNSTQYNSGEQANQHFTVGSSQHMLTLPSDENTIALSSPQRFYLDKNMDNPTSFIVTQNDTTSCNYGKKGLVKVTVYEYPNNTETDRPDLGICDYIDINAKDKVIVKLRIPSDAKRSSATTRKCRCSKAEVIAIYNLDGTEAGKTTCHSDYDNSFIYEVGKTVEVTNFSEDRWDECAKGIHFFINRQEAIDY